MRTRTPIAAGTALPGSPFLSIPTEARTDKVVDRIPASTFSQQGVRA